MSESASDSKVVTLLPNNALCTDLPALAQRVRMFADALERGEYGEVERVCCVFETPTDVAHRTYGRPTTRMELVGMLEYAKNSVLNPLDDED